MKSSADFRPRPFFLLAFLIIAAAHAPSLLSDFLTDDYFNVENALQAGWSWSGLTQGFTVDALRFNDGWQLPAFSGVTVRYFRPLFLVSLRADHALWGLRPWGFHLTNILLHLGVVALLYGVLCELLHGKKAMAWFGALLYGVIYSSPPAVGWLSGRTELLPGLAMMGSLWAYLRFARTGSRLLYVVSVASTAVGLLAKENVVVFPLLLLAAWLWVIPKPRHSAALLTPYFAVVIFYLVLRYRALDGFPLPPPSFYYHPPTEPGFLWWALAKGACLFYDLFLQFGLVFPLDLVLARHPSVTMVLLVPALVIALWFVRWIRTDKDVARRHRLYFAFAWIVLGLLPTAPLLVVGFYLYFPMAAVCLLYLTVWSRLIESGRPRWLNRPRWRKAIPIVVLTISAIWSLVGNSILAVCGQYSRRLVDQVVAETGEPTEGLRVYIVDLPPLVAPLKCALQLRWPGRRFELHFLSLSPYELPVRRPMSDVEQLDSQTLRLTALGRPYLSGIIGFIVLGDRHRDAFSAGQTWEVPGYDIEITQDEHFGRWPQRCPRQIVFHFDEPLASPRNLFLRFSHGTFERIRFD